MSRDKWKGIDERNKSGDNEHAVEWSLWDSHKSRFQLYPLIILIKMETLNIITCK